MVFRFLIRQFPAGVGHGPAGQDGAKLLIGSGAGDCAPAPSHTTGRAVFRIQRLNAATLGQTGGKV